MMFDDDNALAITLVHGYINETNDSRSSCMQWNWSVMEYSMKKWMKYVERRKNIVYKIHEDFKSF